MGYMHFHRNSPSFSSLISSGENTENEDGDNDPNKKRKTKTNC